MVVAVNPVPRQETAMDSIAKALSIASQIYGLKLQHDQMKLMEQKQDAEIPEKARDFYLKFEQVPEGQATAGLPLPQGVEAPKGFGFRPMELGKREMEKEKIAATQKLAESDRMEKRSVKREDISIDLQDDFVKNKQVSTKLDQYNEANNVEKLLLLGTPMSQNLVKIPIIKMMGESGRLSDQDIQRAEGSPDMRSKAKRVVSKYYTGQTFTPQDVEDALEIAGVMKKAAKNTVENLADNFATKRGAALRDFTKTDVYELINPAGLFESRQSTQAQSESIGGAGTALAAPGEGGGYSPGTIVEVNGQRFIVGPDGDTLNPI